MRTASKIKFSMHEKARLIAFMMAVANEAVESPLSVITRSHYKPPLELASQHCLMLLITASGP